MEPASGAGAGAGAGAGDGTQPDSDDDEAMFGDELQAAKRFGDRAWTLNHPRVFQHYKHEALVKFVQDRVRRALESRHAVGQALQQPLCSSRREYPCHVPAPVRRSSTKPLASSYAPSSTSATVARRVPDPSLVLWLCPLAG